MLFAFEDKLIYYFYFDVCLFVECTPEFALFFVAIEAVVDVIGFEPGDEFSCFAFASREIRGQIKE